MYATRKLREDVQGEELVNSLKAANEELLEFAKTGVNVCPAYAEFVNDWCQRDIDDNLVGSLPFPLV